MFWKKEIVSFVKKIAISGRAGRRVPRTHASWFSLCNNTGIVVLVCVLGPWHGQSPSEGQGKLNYMAAAADPII